MLGQMADDCAVVFGSDYLSDKLWWFFACDNATSANTYLWK
ncbi:hypothetical protein QP38_1543 [Levilactobacillus brevis]|nr:hypothetical protein QP38_1543 [Levilactobacillus brevis]